MALHKVAAGSPVLGGGRDLVREEKAAAMCYSKNQ
jgi:hypothetical protein